MKVTYWLGMLPWGCLRLQSFWSLS